MGPASAILLAVLVLIAICLGSRRVRTFLTMIALRRFFDRYMQRPRYRAYFPDERDKP